MGYKMIWCYTTTTLEWGYCRPDVWPAVVDDVSASSVGKAGKVQCAFEFMHQQFIWIQWLILVELLILGMFAALFGYHVGGTRLWQQRLNQKRYRLRPLAFYGLIASLLTAFIGGTFFIGLVGVELVGTNPVTIQVNAHGCSFNPLEPLSSTNSWTMNVKKVATELQLIPGKYGPNWKVKINMPRFNPSKTLDRYVSMAFINF